MMSLRPLLARMSVAFPSQSNSIIYPLQTLRFVQSLPKRERIPFSEKLRTADADGTFLLSYSTLNPTVP